MQTSYRQRYVRVLLAACAAGAIVRLSALVQRANAMVGDAEELRPVAGLFICRGAGSVPPAPCC